MHLIWGTEADRSLVFLLQNEYCTYCQLAVTKLQSLLADKSTEVRPYVYQAGDDLCTVKPR